MVGHGRSKRRTLNLASVGGLLAFAHAPRMLGRLLLSEEIL